MQLNDISLSKDCHYTDTNGNVRDITLGPGETKIYTFKRYLCHMDMHLHNTGNQFFPFGVSILKKPNCMFFKFNLIDWNDAYRE